MQILFNLKFFYYLWLIGHTVLFFLSGYPKKISHAFLKMDWSNFYFMNDKFFPFKDALLADYDLSEYLVYLIVPLILFSIFAKIFGR